MNRPLAQRPADDRRQGQAVIEPRTEERVALDPPRRYRVLLHNDDYTTMEFVVYVLGTFFQHSAVSAVRIMLQVHNEGVGVAGVYPRDIAETKAAEVMAAAEDRGMPLRVTAEPEED